MSYIHYGLVGGPDRSIRHLAPEYIHDRKLKCDAPMVSFLWSRQFRCVQPNSPLLHNLEEVGISNRVSGTYSLVTFACDTIAFPLAITCSQRMGNEISQRLDLGHSTSVMLATDYTSYGVTVGRGKQRNYDGTNNTKVRKVWRNHVSLYYYCCCCC